MRSLLEPEMSLCCTTGVYAVSSTEMIGTWSKKLVFEVGTAEYGCVKGGEYGKGEAVMKSRL